MQESPVTNKQTKRLIETPQAVINEYGERLQQKALREIELESVILKKKKELRLKETEKDRILDLYQSGVVERLELEERVQTLRIKLKTIEEEIDYLQQEKRRQSDQLKLIDRFENFTRRIG